MLAVSSEEQKVIDEINKEEEEIKKNQEEAKKLMNEMATEIGLTCGEGYYAFYKILITYHVL